MISCHDPANFKDPDVFIPERWLIDDSKPNTRCTEAGASLVVPFGVGKRQCPGRRFVEMELMLTIAKVLLISIIIFFSRNLYIFSFLFENRWHVHSTSHFVINLKWNSNFY